MHFPEGSILHFSNVVTVSGNNEHQMEFPRITPRILPTTQIFASTTSPQRVLIAAATAAAAVAAVYNINISLSKDDGISVSLFLLHTQS